MRLVVEMDEDLEPIYALATDGTALRGKLLMCRTLYALGLVTMTEEKALNGDLEIYYGPTDALCLRLLDPLLDAPLPKLK